MTSIKSTDVDLDLTAASSQLEIDALLDASESARQQGRYREGAGLAERAIDLAGSDRALAALGHRLLGLHLTRDGKPEAAVQCCAVAIEAFRELGDRHHLSELLTAQAYAYTLLGLTSEAMEALTESRAVALELQDAELLFWVYGRMGNVYNEMGSAEQAETFLLEAYRRLDSLTGGDQEPRFSINNNLALNAFYRAKRLRAQGAAGEHRQILAAGTSYASVAVELGAKLENPFLLGTALMNLAMLQAVGGHTGWARETLQRSISIAIDCGYRSLEVSARQCTAEVLLLDGEPMAACELIEQVLAMTTEIGERNVELELLALLSQAQEELGDFRGALSSYKLFHALEGSIRSDVTAVRARLLSQDIELDGVRDEILQVKLESESERARVQALQADNEALQMRASELYLTSLQDPLTGLGNRRQLEQTLPKLFAAARLDPHVLCLAVIDIDAFKKVNDTYGHAVGDQVLIRVAALLEGCSRRGDLVGRLGGEEFLIAFPDLDLGAAQGICDRLRVSVESEDWSWVDPEAVVTVSIGLQPMVGCHDVWQQVDRADRAMYRAKQAGRNQVAVGEEQRVSS